MTSCYLPTLAIIALEDLLGAQYWMGWGGSGLHYLLLLDLEEEGTVKQPWACFVGKHRNCNPRARSALLHSGLWIIISDTVQHSG